MNTNTELSENQVFSAEKIVGLVPIPPVPTESPTAAGATILTDRLEVAIAAKNLGIPLGTDINEVPIITIKQAKEILTIEILWDHFHLPGEPARSCFSPFRNEGKPSFSVYENSTGEVCFKDHGDAEYQGDSFEFYRLCTDPSAPEKSMTDHEIYRGFVDLAEKIRRNGTTNRISRPIVNPVAPDLTDYLAKGKEFSAKLLASPETITRIAESRNWLPETITKLADEGSLGWDDSKMTFNYQCGIKFRTLGERNIFWKGISGLWRRHRLESAVQIYICEGETDCISLLDAGIESDSNRAVVAAPSATASFHRWVAEFSGKNVVLCFDNDRAGHDATDKFGKLLQPVAATVKVLNLKGALK